MLFAICRLSTEELLSIATGLRSGRVTIPVSPLSLKWLASPATAIDLAAALESLQAGGSATQLAMALDLLHTDRASRRDSAARCDLVTTGPEAKGVTHRGTATVVRDLFASAEHSVLVVGYAVYGGARIFEPLAKSMVERPELKVRLCLDVRRERGDTSTDAAICRRFLEQFRSKEWPTGSPLPEIYFDP